MTYSIVGRDAVTGELGIAVQSRYFGAGRIVPWIEAGVGAIASQAWVNPAYGYKGLALLRDGAAPAAILEALTGDDRDAAIRQVGVIDAGGRAAAFTGDRCFTHAGHAVGENCVAQANMCAGEVWLDMVSAFEKTPGDLANRLLAALMAGELAGGDIRGAQAASLIVVGADMPAAPGLDRTIDLRIDDHPDPVPEIARLLRYRRAIASVDEAVALAGSGQLQAALKLLNEAAVAIPGDPEVLSSRALVLAGLGRIAEARADAADCIRFAPGWREFFLEMASKGMVPMTTEQIAALLP